MGHPVYNFFQYGKRRLTVDVDYKRVPLGYKYLEQYHGFKHPLAGTEIHKDGYGNNNQVWSSNYFIVGHEYT